VFEVAHHADDLEVRQACVAGAEHHVAAQRIALAEEAPHKRLVDHHHFVRRGEVALDDFTAAHHGRTQRAKIARAHGVPRDIHIFVFARLIAFHGDVAAAVAVGERTGAGGAGGDHSGQPGEPLLQIVEQGEAALLRVAIQRRIDGEGEQPLRAEAGIHAQQVEQAAGEQAGAHQQQQRKRQLRDHQNRGECAPLRPRSQSGPLLAQRGSHFGAAGLQRRRESEQQAREGGKSPA
jgi:hypothetical protein